MSRSGYSDEGSHLWRGAVKAALKGRRGQKFLVELLAVLEAMPEKKLISGELVDEHGSFCSLGAVGAKRGLDLTAIDYDDPQVVANAFGIARALAAEIEFMNDEWPTWSETPENRWNRMYIWVQSEIEQELNR